MRTKRIDEIELYIQQKKSVSLDTLCEKFQVSKNTIRRDIDTLSKAGKIKKVYGGVTLAEPTASKNLTPFSERHQQYREENVRSVNWRLPILMTVILFSSVLVRLVTILLILFPKNNVPF